MNVRKPVDYAAMFTALDAAMAADLPQMELYCEIGRAVGLRTEKGAAVAATEYLSSQYPEQSGFSPRNVRRMRDFYRTYEGIPSCMEAALQIGWTLNVVIMENCESCEMREVVSPRREAKRLSKLTLMAQIRNAAHLTVILDIETSPCYNDTNENVTEKCDDKDTFYLPRQDLPGVMKSLKSS